MDKQETYIHSFLGLDNWNLLKGEGFYNCKITPLTTFEAEYQLQYLHYTSYFKLGSAYFHLRRIKSIKYFDTDSLFVLKTEIDNFLQDIFSVCDLLAQQIYILYSNQSINLAGQLFIMVNMHNLRENYKRLINPNGEQEFLNLYDSYIKRIIDDKNSWYYDLKYYRNNCIHGLIKLIFQEKDKFYLLKKDKLEKNFNLLGNVFAKSGKDRTPDEINEVRPLYREDDIIIQLEVYFDFVKKFSDSLWGEMYKYYSMFPAKIKKVGCS